MAPVGRLREKEYSMDGPTVLIVVLAAAFVSMVVFFAIQNGKKAGKSDGREIRSSQPSRRH